jgi:hypothetical protein
MHWLHRLSATGDDAPTLEEKLFLVQRLREQSEE